MKNKSMHKLALLSSIAGVTVSSTPMREFELKLSRHRKNKATRQLVTYYTVDSPEVKAMSK